MNSAGYYPFSDFSSRLTAPAPIRTRKSVFGNIRGMTTQPLRKVVADNVRRLQKAQPELQRQADLARAANVSQSSINRLLEGETNCLLITALEVAKAFGVSLYELIEEDGAKDKVEIDYDRSGYATLGAAEKERIAAFIKFTIANRDGDSASKASSTMRSKETLAPQAGNKRNAHGASESTLTKNALRANENIQHKPQRKRGSRG
ncbi:helix-turn-helix transcriptional regulator [Paraburkholderia sp. Cy-641]|uniref:helix-turn-helix transcriptional regulator n=1 Tax=Paraburkholderia sp. Cy-641 TaxID=2608337 RepID=UPI00141FAA54|nr:helix-turn-helix transcriptional regulator [Paraburkholderia sp. Cy-641]NIF80156.1 helix-turn-helix transcriptional regulator [Paraburkholderia sp. Cy-641]